jgi:hypothetical protein
VVGFDENDVFEVATDIDFTNVVYTTTLGPSPVQLTV